MSANPGPGPEATLADGVESTRHAPEPTRVLSLVLTERDLVALVQTLADDDAPGALHFLRTYVQGKLLREGA